MILSKDLTAFHKLISNKENELKKIYKHGYEIYFKEYLMFLHMVINDIKFCSPITNDVVPIKKKYECGTCLKKFSNNQSYKKHVSNGSCVNARLYVCSNCDVQFKTKTRYIKHITRKHRCFRDIKKIDTKFKCEHCNNLFVARSKCEIHINKSSNCREYYNSM